MSDEPLISQEELDILSTSMDIAQAQAGTGEPAEVALYDFRDATRLLPDQAHELRDRCTVLAKVLSRTLSAYLNVPLAVSFEGLDHPTFDQYLRGLPPNPIIAIFTLDPHSPAAVWQIDPAIALPLLDTMLGASEPSPTQPSHELTPIESALLTRLFDEMLHTWTLTWPALAQLNPTVDALATTLATLDISSQAQDIVHATFRLTLGEITAPANLALPQTSLQRLLRRSTNTQSDTADPSPLSLHGPVSHHAVRSVITLAAEIARIRLPLRYLSNLKPGDLIHLHTHPAQPLTITIAGTPKLQAEPGQYMAHLAARIIGHLPAP